MLAYDTSDLAPAVEPVWRQNHQAKRQQRERHNGSDIGPSLIELERCTEQGFALCGAHPLGSHASPNKL